MSKITIAIDGYSSCGKSSTAKRVSQKLGYSYVDTGAMYRAVTLFLIENNVPLSDLSAISDSLELIHLSFKYSENGHNDIWMNDINVEKEIRKMYVSEKVSIVSAIADVRQFLVSQQKCMANEGGLVMDGRDIGTVVFPEAELKVFMTADPAVRAVRRQKELHSQGELVEIENIMENIAIRDFQDINRSESPLVKAKDAFFLDNSFVTLEEQVELIVNLASQRICQAMRSRSAGATLRTDI